MSLFSVFDVAGTGMSAQSVRLNLVASNIANADSASSNPENVYRSRQPVFETLLNQFEPNGQSRGVQVTEIIEKEGAPKQRYAPDHPLADETGYIYLPNVNPVEEMANMISASRAYQSNIEVVNTSKQLLLRTLRLGQ